MLLKKHDKSLPLNSTHYAMLYPQNGDRIVAVDFVTLFHPMYRWSVHVALRCPSVRPSVCPVDRQQQPMCG